METTTKYEVKQIIWPEKSFITKRDKVAFDKLPAFFGEAYGALYAAINKNGLTPDGMPYAIYYDVNEFKKETDVAAAVAVKEKLPDIKDFKKVSLPASKVVFTTHYGSYENMAPAYAEIEKYVKENSLKKTLIIEEYFSDPALEKDPGKWKTNIYFVVR